MRTITKQEIRDMEIKKDRLVICGAGHVALAVIKVARLLGFSIIVIEDRPLFANQAREILREETDYFQNKVLCEAFDKALSEETGSAQTYFVIVTRGHRYDLDCLRSILKKPYAYVGMMGSRGRSERVRQALLEEGFSKETVDTLHSPIGLAIGAKTPEEIAVSIMSEIIQVRSELQFPAAKAFLPNVKGTDIKKSGEECLLPQIELTEEIRAALLQQDTMNGILAVITDRKGSAPRTVGTAMAVFQDGRTAGTIGGGCMEAEVTREALLRLNQNADERADSGTIPDILEVRMLPEEAETEGMVCGGIIWVELLNVSGK